MPKPELDRSGIFTTTLLPLTWSPQIREDQLPGTCHLRDPLSALLPPHSPDPVRCHHMPLTPAELPFHSALVSHVPSLQCKDTDFLPKLLQVTHLISLPLASTASIPFPGIPTRLRGRRLKLSANTSVQITERSSSALLALLCLGGINMATTRLPGSPCTFRSLLHCVHALPEPWPAPHVHGLSRFHCEAPSSGLLPDGDDGGWPVSCVTALWTTSYSHLWSPVSSASPEHVRMSPAAQNHQASGTRWQEPSSRLHS